MFCQNCGKELPENESVCTNCGKAEITAAKQPTGVMHGFPKGLTSVILGFAGITFALFAYIFALIGFAAATDPYDAIPAGEMLGLIPVFLVFALPPCIIALSFGIKSIKLFISVRKARSGKAPIPAFGCGIAGIATAALGMFILLIALCFASLTLALL